MQTRQFAHPARLLALLALLLSAPAVATAQEGTPAPGPLPIRFEELAGGFDRPLGLVDPGDGSGRLFVVEQGGTIRILLNGQTLPEPFLDISDQVSDGFEQGLLSIAFHPKVAENGAFFIDYTDRDGNTRVERWTVDPADPNRADPASATLVLGVEQPFPNHNGGLLLFGPDGKLYVGLGDGGSGGDPEGNGQNTQTLLGSILRIDVDDVPDGATYGIPADNPFASGGGAPEVWLWGLRNPWRFSFDRATGDLWIADVGQGTWEEIDRYPANDPSASRNFGWDVTEGPACFAAESCDRNGLADPVFWYDHDTGGCSVTGGYVYRGAAMPDLNGTYLLDDFCSGKLWGLRAADDGTWSATAPLETGMAISAFGEDAAGELYVLDQNGAVYRIVAA